MEVGGKDKFIAFGIVKEIDENITKGVNSMIGGSKHQDPRKVIDHVM